MSRSSSDNAFQTTRVERLTFPVYCMGKGITFSFLSGYLMLYLTDSLFISAFAVSAILLVTKAWDAINDPLFGMIVDRAHLKRGKFIPWLRISQFLIPVATLLIFIIPQTASMGGRIAMALITYTLWGMSFTMSDVPIYSVLTAMTSNLNERTRLLSYQGIMSLFTTLIINVLIVPRLDSWGFTTAGIIVSVVSLGGMLFFPFVVQERNREKIVAEEKYKIRDIWDYVVRNKYMLYYYGFICIFGIFNLPLSTYVIKHCLGSLEYVSTFTLFAIPVLILLYIFVPVIARKMDRMKIFKFFVFVLLASYIGMFFGGYANPMIFGMFWILISCSLLMSSMLLFSFGTDFVEYGNYITGMRKEGITIAVQTFANKIVAAAAAALGALVLGIISYDPEAVTHTPEMLNMLFAVSCWVPVAGILLGLPLLMKCVFTSSDIQIMANVNNGTLSRQDGEERLSRHYE